MRLDVRQREHQVVAQLVDALRQFSGELFVGGGQRKFRARMNHVRHGLGLREVNAAVEKSALGEFARLGQPRAVCKSVSSTSLAGQQSAVAGNFDGVLARKRARRAQDGEQHFVNHFSVADDFAKLDRVRRRGGWF